MAAIRYHSDFLSFTGDPYRIEIWDTEYSGSSTEFRTTSDGFVLNFEGENADPHNPMLPTSCDIQFLVQNTDHEEIITELMAGEEGRFLVKITWTASHIDYWHGVVLPDIGSYQEAYYPYVLTLKATDGLAALKTIDFNNAGSAYTGKDRLTGHLLKALSKIRYWDVFFASGDNVLSSHIDWWETAHTHTSGSACALYQTYLDHAAWITYEKSTPGYKSCYDVIREIMIVMGARITMANGSFWVEQISYRTASTVIGRGYSKAGAFLGTGNFSGANVIDQTPSGALEAVGVYEFYAALDRHEHTFKSLLRRNFLAGVPEFNESTFLPVTVQKPINSNSNATTLRFVAQVNITIANNTAPGAPWPPFAAVFRVRIKVGTKYCRRPIELTAGYQIIEQYANWSTSPDFVYFAVPISDGFLLGNTSSNIVSLNKALEFMSPGVPESADNFDFEFSFVDFWKYDGGAIAETNFDFTYSLNNPNLLAYSYGNPVQSEDERLHICFNTIHPNNSLKTQSESFIGTATDPNTIGALWVYSGSAYSLASSWGEGSETPGGYIEDRLCETVVSARHVAIRKLKGRLLGNITALARVWWIGEKWLLIGGSWTAGDDTFSGEWMEQNFGTGLTTSPPIKSTIKVIDGTVPTAPQTGGTVGSSYEITTRPPATILTPLSLTNTSSALMLPPGTTTQAVTAIPISEVLTDGDLYTGDTVAIINPLTGAWDELTVTSTTVAGQTSIAVSGNLTSSYPVGSTIFKKPKIGQFTLGPGIANTLTYWDAINTVAGIAKTYVLADEMRLTDYIIKFKSAATSSEMWLSADTEGSKIQSYGSLPLYINKLGNAIKMPQLAGGTERVMFIATDGTIFGDTLIAADLPGLPASQITSGVLPIARGGTGLGTLGTALHVLRVNAAGTALEYAAVSGGITGTLTATRVPVASGAGTVVDFAEMVFISATKTLQLGGGTGVGALNILQGSVAGDNYPVYANANGSSILGFKIQNVRNFGGVGSAVMHLEVGGTSAADPYVLFVIPSGTTWSEGPDNSDSDIYKVGPYSAPGGGVLGMHVRPTGEVAFGAASLTTLAILFGLQKPMGIPSGTDSTRATGNTYANVHWNTSSNRLEVVSPGGGYYKPIVSYAQPTWTVGAPAGSGATAALEVSSSNAVTGTIRLTTGTGPTSGAVITVTVSGNMGGTAFVQLTARNSATAGQMTNFYISAATVTTFTISVNSALAASTVYLLNYRCDG